MDDRRDAGRIVFETKEAIKSLRWNDDDDGGGGGGLS
jgi:hypothetical protein